VAAPVLEINPGHALVRRFETAAEGEQREDLALLLLEQAQLADGGSLEDPASFVRRVNRLLAA
jgi:molecular chaperone HtpG